MTKLRRAMIGSLVCILLIAFNLTAEAAGAKTASAPEPSFRDPPRAYERHARKFNIYVERSLLAGDAKLADEALGKLERSVAEVFAALPERAASELKNLRFYLLWGTDAPEGGRDSGMSYIRRGEPLNYPKLDPEWNHVVVVYSAVNLMYLDSTWTKKALMHELAHAWHITHWPEKHPPILNAYQAAKAEGRYRQIKDRKGKVIPEAYALTNQLEYFAELSAMYFVGGNYFPFDRAGVTNYDPTGARMVRDLWNVK
ncbi:hypothetical protein ACFPN2_19360 [Steroidobacter flavus]|uniref:Uncharacterized protein n=1 Tax=Steroidobacter flavus TaxID=1842136 RepID=A0ABV8SUM8_9GAMM